MASCTQLPMCMREACHGLSKVTCCGQHVVLPLCACLHSFFPICSTLLPSPSTTHLIKFLAFFTFTIVWKNAVFWFPGFNQATQDFFFFEQRLLRSSQGQKFMQRQLLSLNTILLTRISWNSPSILLHVQSGINKLFSKLPNCPPEIGLKHLELLFALNNGLPKT